MECKKPERFDWDYYNSILMHFYHVDPCNWTWGQYLGYMKQLPNLRLFIAGKSKRGMGVEALSPEEWAAAVMEGRITPELGDNVPQMKEPGGYDPQIAKEQAILEQMGITRPS